MEVSVHIDQCIWAESFPRLPTSRRFGKIKCRDNFQAVVTVAVTKVRRRAPFAKAVSSFAAD